MQEYVKVKIELTKVEMVITKEMYDQYPKDFIHLGPYVEEKPANTLSAMELKTLCDDQGIEYKGNASKADLLDLLGD